MSHQWRAAEEGETCETGTDGEEDRNGVGVLMGSDMACVWDGAGRCWLWFWAAGGWFSEVSACLAVCQEPVGGRSRSFRNALCCCGWPTSIHSLIQNLSEYRNTHTEFSVMMLFVSQLQSSIYSPLISPF